MAKRLLISAVFCFVSLSLAMGQCNKVYVLDVNKFYDFSSSNNRETNKFFVCEGNTVELKLKDVNANDLTFLWYKNDSLLNESGTSLSINKNGLYRVEIKENNCTYSFNKLNLEFTKYLQMDIRAL